MLPRLALILLVVFLALLVCASSIWLLPAGQGSFSAVHGPTSHLVARRNAARVLLSIRFNIRLMLVAATVQAPTIVFPVGHSAAANGTDACAPVRLSPICPLLC